MKHPEKGLPPIIFERSASTPAKSEKSTLRLYACGKCGVIPPVPKDAADEERKTAALACCVPQTCDTCGEEIKEQIFASGYVATLCWECTCAASDAREEARMDKARQIAENAFTGEGVIFNENFYPHGDDLRDEVAENGLLLPARIWTAREVRFDLNAEEILSAELEHQDFGRDDHEDEFTAEEIADLQALLNLWLAAHSTTRWTEDTTAVVVLNTETKEETPDA